MLGKGSNVLMVKKLEQELLSAAENDHEKDGYENRTRRVKDFCFMAKI